MSWVRNKERKNGGFIFSMFETLIWFDFCHFIFHYYRRKLIGWENKEDPQLMAYFKKVKENKMLKY